MKVQELIDKLKCLPKDAEVFLQKDAEGNHASPLEEISGDCVFLESEGADGEVYDTTWSADGADMEKQEWDECLKLPRCVTLWP